MAVTYGFYDSLNHDRLYNAQQMSAIFDGIINDGVFMSVGNQFHTVAGTGMQVIVKSGRAWFDSTWTLNDAEYPLSIDAADVLLTRIDAVVLEVNSEVATRANTIKIVKGTPASTPTKPTLTNTATIHQHALAYVTVAKNTTAITNSMIEIVVGKTETPYVTAILQTTDITDLYNQWEDYFQTWFDTVRSTLDGDVALNLQNQITSLRRETLKPTTPPIIGLPPSTTPDGMFQALGNTGELHVWRKTEKVGSKGYYLDSVSSGRLSFVKNGASVVTFSYSDTVSPNGALSGTVNTVSLSGTGDQTSKLSVLRGKFCRAESSGDSDSAFSGIIYIPNDATFTYKMEGLDYHSHYVDKKQTVVFTDAPTTTTYPVSTNPNAYQEGSDAKPAGYVLGDVVIGRFKLEGYYNSSHPTYYYADNTPTVSDDGVVSVKDIYGFSGYGSGQDALQTRIRGKYIQCRVDDYTQSDFRNLGVVYIPEDAVVLQYNSASGVYIDRYQPVTGYPAIPAGTTIEYLGKLGDKARMQVVSYVGTGMYGESNPTSLTFDFVPKMLFVVGNYTTNWPSFMFATEKTACANSGNSSYHPTFTIWNKTVKWYYIDAESQFNTSNKNYDAVAIG